MSGRQVSGCLGIDADQVRKAGDSLVAWVDTIDSGPFSVCLRPSGASAPSSPLGFETETKSSGIWHRHFGGSTRALRPPGRELKSHPLVGKCVEAGLHGSPRVQGDPVVQLQLVTLGEAEGLVEKLERLRRQVAVVAMPLGNVDDLDG